MSEVLRLARPYALRLTLAGLLAAGTELAGLALMGTAVWLLVRAAEAPPVGALALAIVTVRALAIGRGVLRYTERLAGHDAALRLLTEVRTRIYASLATQREPGQREPGQREPGQREPGRTSTGDLLSRLVSDVDAVQELLLRCLVPAAAAGVVAGAAITAAVAMAPLAGVALAAGLLVAGIALPGAAAALARADADQVAPLRGALAADAVDLTRGAPDLAAFGATGRALAAADERITRLATVERRLAARGLLVDAAGVLVAGATSVTVLAAAVRAGADGRASAVLAVGTLVAVEAALALVGSARRWVEIRAPIARVAELLDPEPAPPGLKSAGNTGLRSVGDTGLGSAGNTGQLRLTGVTVRYEGRPEPALSSVDLTVPAGHRVAVVGPSGAGKSTLLAVIAGQVRPDSGRVAPGGHVSGLLADAHVFHATVRENLALARPDADPEALRGALATVGLRDWLDAQPRGLDTVVGEDGGQLSGGQRQRLALARGVLAAPDVLLLDEPTEGLDPQAADEVLTGVLAAARGATVLLVTHRLHGLDQLDEVVVLDRGRVVQRGAHSVLIERPGWYRDHCVLQPGPGVQHDDLVALADPAAGP